MLPFGLVDWLPGPDSAGLAGLLSAAPHMASCLGVTISNSAIFTVSDSVEFTLSVHWQEIQPLSWTSGKRSVWSLFPGFLPALVLDGLFSFKSSSALASYVLLCLLLVCWELTLPALLISQPPPVDWKEMTFQKTNTLGLHSAVSSWPRINQRSDKKWK